MVLFDTCACGSGLEAAGCCGADDFTVGSDAVLSDDEELDEDEEEGDEDEEEEEEEVLGVVVDEEV